MRVVIPCILLIILSKLFILMSQLLIVLFESFVVNERHYERCYPKQSQDSSWVMDGFSWGIDDCPKEFDSENAWARGGAHLPILSLLLQDQQHVFLPTPTVLGLQS